MFSNKKITFYLSLCLLIIILISLKNGRYYINISELIKIILQKSDNKTAINVFYQIRLPRTLFAVLAGSALSLSGLIYQSVFRNPLVSPEVLGVAGGCSVAAVACIVFGISSALILQLSTFIIGILVVLFAITLSKMFSGNKILAMVLTGIIASSISTSIIMLLKYIADPNKQLGAIEFWLMGGLSNISFNDFLVVLPIIISSFVGLYFLRYKLKVLALGDNEAASLGINIQKTRFFSIIFSTILVSSIISIAGVISWIGLIAPHIVKIITGEDIIKNFFPSMLCGAILLSFADLIARTLYSAELPISILTSFIGALFLFALFLKRGRKYDY